MKSQWILWEVGEKLDLIRSHWKVSELEKGQCQQQNYAHYNDNVIHWYW